MLNPIHILADAVVRNDQITMDEAMALHSLGLIDHFKIAVDAMGWEEDGNLSRRWIDFVGRPTLHQCSVVETCWYCGDERNCRRLEWTYSRASDGMPQKIRTGVCKDCDHQLEGLLPPDEVLW